MWPIWDIWLVCWIPLHIYVAIYFLTGLVYIKINPNLMFFLNVFLKGQSFILFYRNTSLLLEWIKSSMYQTVMEYVLIIKEGIKVYVSLSLFLKLSDSMWPLFEALLMIIVESS